MKIGKIITLLCAACIGLAAQAANVVTLSSGSGHPGDEIEMAVSLDNADEVTAIEVLIPLDESLSYVESSCTLNADRSADHQLTAAVVDGTLKVYIYSLSLSPLNGNSGVVATFKLLMGKEPKDYTLTPQVTLSDAAGTAVESTVTSGVVTLLSPKMEVVTQQIDFGHIPIRSTYTRSLTLRNVGNEPLIVNGITTNSSVLTPTETALTIPAGESKSVSLTYAPVERGAYQATVTVASNAVNGNAHTATVVADPFSVNELHAASVSGISDEVVTVTLRMNNMEPIVAAQCDIKLPEALVYVEGSAKALRSGNHEVTASVDEKNVLRLVAYSLNNTAFDGNDGDLLSFDLRLNGMSGYYTLKLTDVVLANVTQENMTSATSNGSVRIKSPAFDGGDSFDFGEVDITAPAEASYPIKNKGQAPLTIERVAMLSDGYEVVTSLPLTIEAGSSDEITLRYTPSVAGKFDATMQVYSNAPDTRMKSVTVNGNVYEPNSISLIHKGGAVDTLSVALSNYSEIVAAQFDIIGLHVSNDFAVINGSRISGHQLSITRINESTHRVIIFSMNNAAITGHEGELFSVTLPDFEGEVTILAENIVLSDKLGANRCSKPDDSVTISPSTGVESISVDGGSPVEWYNLQGVKVDSDNLGRGIYIRRQGSTTQKVML